MGYPNVSHDNCKHEQTTKARNECRDDLRAYEVYPGQKNWDGVTTDARALKDSYFKKGKK